MISRPRATLKSLHIVNDTVSESGPESARSHFAPIATLRR